MKKKICFVVSAPGTARAFLKAPMEKLQQDFDIYLVANFKDEKEIEGLPLSGYRTIPIERQPSVWKDIKALWQLYRYFKQENFFSVHSMASKPSLLNALAGAMVRAPHRIRTFTGQIWWNMTGLKRRFFKLIDRLTVKLNTELLTDGKPQIAILEKNGILKPHQIQVLANGSICGVDTGLFKFDQSVRKKMRNKLGLTNKVVFVYLGRLKREKGIFELMSAFNRICRDCPNSVLLLVGIDEQNCGEWVSQFEHLKKGENIILYGFAQSQIDLLHAGDIFCMPSYREGFNVSVLEASCLGLPVICSDIYGTEGSVINGVTGLRCKVKDDVSLAECMKKMYDHPELREEYGRNAHERIVNYFSREIVTDAWSDFYNKLK